MGSLVWSLLGLGVALNLTLGVLVAGLKVPLYLDSLGTVLVGALAGPWPGMLCGFLGVALLGITSPTALAFAPVGAVLGLVSGGLAYFGAFRRLATAVLAGAFAGIVGATLAAPIAVKMFGGLTGGGTDLVIALFRAHGLSAWQAALAQSLIVDSFDKALAFGLVFLFLRDAPSRILGVFPMATKLPQVKSGNRVLQRTYHPRKLPSSQENSRIERPVSSTDPLLCLAPLKVPEAEVEWKLLALGGLLGVAMKASSLAVIVGAGGALWLAFAAFDLRLAREVGVRVALLTFPLWVSLSVVQGLLDRPLHEAPFVVLGLSWYLSGLQAAAVLVGRIVLILLAFSFFFRSTPLHRLTGFLQQMRCPYPLIFVVLTTGTLAHRLKTHWRRVEEAQAARGLNLVGGGLGQRVKVVLGMVQPALGAVFSELPQRAANLQSRGLLNAKPLASIPRSWTGERTVTWQGTAFYALVALAAWGGLWFCG